MMAQVSAWFLGLTARERVLVAVAGTLAALVVLVYGIVLPVGRALDAAALRHGEAVTRSARLMGDLTSLDAPAPRVAAGGNGPIDQQVAASAGAAGFVLQSNQAQGADAAQVSIPGVQPALVLGWLDGLAGQGIAIEALTITPGADGTVSVNATLRRAGK